MANGTLPIFEGWTITATERSPSEYVLHARRYTGNIVERTGLDLDELIIVIREDIKQIERQFMNRAKASTSK